MQRTIETPNPAQSGFSVLAALLVVALIGAVGTLSVRLIPHYIDYRTILSVIEELPQDRVHDMSSLEIRESLGKRFKINNIRDLDLAKILKIERKRDGTSLILDYERREPLVYNVDLVLHFAKQFHYS